MQYKLSPSVSLSLIRPLSFDTKLEIGKHKEEVTSVTM